VIEQSKPIRFLPFQRKVGEVAKRKDKAMHTDEMRLAGFNCSFFHTFRSPGSGGGN
jgi:hypothetical protein